MHTETVEKSTLDLLEKLQSHRKLENFTLVGGTALALHFGHRVSIDLDLFSEKEFDSEQLSSILQKDFSFRETFRMSNTLMGFIDGVKVDVITHPYKNIAPVIIYGKIRIASVNDIAAMKVNAIYNSGKRVKDFIDVYFLLKEKSMSEIVECFKQKYSFTNPTPAFLSLGYFEDVLLDDWPRIFTEKNLKWDTVKNKILSELLTYQKNLITDNETKFIQAIHDNNTEQMKELIKQGIKPNEQHLHLIEEMKKNNILVRRDVKEIIERHLSHSKNRGFKI